MNQTFQQNMAIVSGVARARPEQQLSQAAKLQIAKSYFQMYFGLSMTNWLAGGKLGAAWHKAIRQMDTFIAGKNANNPATMYLRQIHAAHRARWAQVTMTNPNRDTEIKCPPENKKEWQALANKEVGAGMNGINVNIDKFKPQTSQKATAPSYLDAQQKMQAMILMRLAQNQNGGMAA